MQNRFVIIDDIGTERDFTPYNYNEIKIVDKRSTLTRAWMWDKHIDDIEILGADYDYVYNLINTNKCVDYYIKWYCDGALKYYGYFNYYSCDIDKDGCKMSIKSEEYNAAYKYFLLRYDQEFDLDVSVAQVPDYDQVQGKDRAYHKSKKINDILDFLADRCGLTVSSKFLRDAVCPIIVLPNDLESPYDNIDTSTYNPYNQMFLARTLETDELKTSLKDMLNALCEQYFNLYWHIDYNTNILHIEHALYYINNKSYTINNSVGLDLTTINGGEYVIDTNKYSIDKQEIFNRTSWEPQYKQHQPFIIAGTPFPANAIYGWQLYSNCSPDINNTKDISQNYETYVKMTEYISASCLLLFCTYEDPAFLGWYRVYLHWDGTPYIMGSEALYNYPFEHGYGWHLWRWNAESPIAYYDLNKPEQIMKSMKYVLKQVDIEFPLCCDELDLNKLVRTNMGDGMIDEASLNISTGMCTLKLKYADI